VSALFRMKGSKLNGYAPLSIKALLRSEWTHLRDMRVHNS
jgi:hypothetical protein